MTTATLTKTVGMTVARAARVLDVTPTMIYRWLADGALNEVPVDGRITLVSGESVERLKAEREGKADQ